MLQVGDRGVYTPTKKNEGVLEWAGISGHVKEIYYDNIHPQYGMFIDFEVDPEYRYRIGGEMKFQTYSSRITKTVISWEV
jgi:hypothetical protein